MTVGTRELKNKLSEYLRRVKRGEVITVTDRGEVVAELRPVAKVKTPRTERERGRAALERLAAKGVVTLGTGEFEDFEPIRLPRGAKPTSKMIIEDRG